ncbi:MAG: MCP four helix bundle domain-containing protein, partial [Nevskia sp.]|nr:MCP four helix bundle domain-containing protein [Nevskia sp.]
MNLKVGQRLALGFGAVLALSALMLSVALYCQRQLGEKTHALADKDNKTELVNGLLQGDLEQLARLQRMLLALDDKSEVKQLKDEIEAGDAENDARLAQLREAVKSEDGKQLLGLMLDKRKTWLDERKEFTGAVTDGGDAKGLESYFFGTALPVQQAYTKALTDLLEHQRQTGAESLAAAEKTAREARGIELGVAALLLLFAAACAWLITRSIVRPLRRSVGLAEAVSGGKLDNAVTVTGRDETAGLLRSLKSMQDNLRQRIEAERKTAAENLRIKNALDSCGASVMIADNDCRIIYGNGSMMRMLAEAEEDIRTSLPEFQAGGVIGSGLDMFQRQAELGTGVLQGLQSTHRTQIELGGRSFKLAASPNLSPSGERMGTVVEWIDYTAEAKAWAEVGTIVEAAAVGDFSHRMSIDGKDGVFKLLAENLNQLVQTTESSIGEVARVLASLAQGDLTQAIARDFQGIFGKLKQDANRTVQQLAEIVSGIKQTSESINVAAREISAGNGDLSARTEQQAASLQETASSMEELTGTVKQ